MAPSERAAGKERSGTASGTLPAIWLFQLAPQRKHSSNQQAVLSVLEQLIECKDFYIRVCRHEPSHLPAVSESRVCTDHTY